MLDTNTTEAAPAASAPTAAPATPAPAAPVAAETNANTTTTTATPVNGEVKVVVEQKPAPTPEEIEKKDRTELRAKQQAVVDKARAQQKFEDGGVNPEKQNPDGTFKAKAADPNAPAPVKPADPKTVDPKAAEAKATETEKPVADAKPIPAPASWKKEMKAEWDKVPAEIKPYLLDYEKTFARTYHQVKGEQAAVVRQLESAKPVLETLNKYDEMFKRWGLPRHEAIAGLVENAIAEQNDPVGLAKHILSRNGVDIGALVSESIDPSLLPPDPRVNQMTMEINRLQRELAQERQLKKAEQEEQTLLSTTQHRQAIEEQKATVTNWLESFAQTDPDFQSIEDDVADYYLMPAIRKHGFTQKAFDEAVKVAKAANPAVQQATLTRQLQETEKKRAAEAKRLTDAARAAQAINVQSSVADPSQLSLRAKLTAIAARHRATG